MPETTTYKDQKYGPIVAIVNSRSEADKKYEVRRRPEDGALTCNCMGWRFNRDRPRHCKHTDSVAQNRVGAWNASVAAVARRSTNFVNVKPQVASPIRVEAELAAHDVMRLTVPAHRHPVPTSTSKEVADRIERAIRRFLASSVEAAVTAVAEVRGQEDDEDELGVRYITLED